MRTASHQTRAAVTPPNFAAVARNSLTALIHKLAVTKAAAEQACTVLSRAEDDHRDADGKLCTEAKPKVLGGMTEAQTIIVKDKAIEIAACEWFFGSRDEIKKHGTAEHLAEWDRQAKACKRAFPKAMRDAERVHGQALDVWTAAEWAVANYRPKSAEEAIELLALAGNPQKRGALFLDVDDEAHRTIARNCAAALRKALAQ